MSARKDLSALLGNSVPKAAKPHVTPSDSSAAAIQQPAPTPTPTGQQTPSPVTPSQESPGARWRTFERKETRLRADQLEWLEETRKDLNQKRGIGMGERLTDNTLIRLAVDLLRQREGDLAGATEEDLAFALGLR